MSNAAPVHIGISGWTYAPWRGTFFPDDLPQREELSFASRKLHTIEINGTFYSLQRVSSFQRWHDATPENFVFSVKAPRFITHIKRLKEFETPLANFLASGLLNLRAKLGPILWQLPPSFRFDADRLARFFTHLPRTTDDAARLARHHDHRVAKFSVPSDHQSRPLRHALEVRHPSFATPEFIALLREHDIALVVADTAGEWPFLEDVTSDFVYVRLHGESELYVSGYTPAALADWARKIRAWRRGKNFRAARLAEPKIRIASRPREVFAYFDNDVKVRAPYDAMQLAWRLRTGAKPGRPPPVKSIAETPRTRWPGFGPKRVRAA